MKSKLAWLVVLLALVGATPRAWAQRQATAPAMGLEERIARVENGLLPSARLKDDPPSWKLADRMAHHKVPGLSVAVVNNGKLEWARGYGVVDKGGQPVTAETLFQAGSVSKPVAALAAIRLVGQGALSLDEDVNAKLKTWKVPENDFTKEKKVTLQGLLSHSAGLTVHGFKGYAVDAPMPTLVQVLNGEKPANSPAIRVDLVPGTRYRYAGGGYTVLQQMLIDVAGKPFPELMRALVLSPAGMSHSTYEQPIPASMAPLTATGHIDERSAGTSNQVAVKGRWHVYPEMAAAGLWTTPSDLANVIIAMQQALAGKSELLTQDLALEMMKPRLAGFGLGFSLAKPGEPNGRFAHNGRDEGFDTVMEAYTQTGQGAVIMMNANTAEIGAELIRSIAQEYNWPDYPLPDR